MTFADELRARVANASLRGDELAQAMDEYRNRDDPRALGLLAEVRDFTLREQEWCRRQPEPEQRDVQAVLNTYRLLLARLEVLCNQVFATMPGRPGIGGALKDLVEFGIRTQEDT